MSRKPDTNVSPGNASPGNASDIARSIRRMTLLVRSSGLRQLRADALADKSRTSPQPGQGSGKAFEEAPAAQPGKRPSPYAGKTFGKPGLDAEPKNGEWWVLAQGRALDPDDFDAREAARADLLEAVLRAGVLVPENIWVWDESARAQLVLATLPTQERAWRVAERLRQKGLAVIVRREMP